jgi:hypothetical protein
MERVHRARRVSCLAVAVATGCSVLAAGCGSDEPDYANQPRPPAPIVISASIGADRVSVSPRRFGAGPITLIVTNQTERAQDLTLETDEIRGEAPGIEQSSGPINPGDTASLKADLRSGTYRIAVDGRGISGTRLNVGSARPSSQNDLLQP